GFGTGHAGDVQLQDLPWSKGGCFLAQGVMTAPGQHTTAAAGGGAGNRLLEDGGRDGREALGFAVVDHLGEGILLVQREDTAVKFTVMGLDSYVILLADVVSRSQHGPFLTHLIIETRLRRAPPYPI